MSTQAQKLKEEADALFRSQEFKAASKKYSEAIKLDEANPILFPNRSLCSFKSKEYLNAAADATMAVSLDPSYVKAHVRRAEASDALHRDYIGQMSWQAALNALPKDNLTPSEKAAKEACERGYAESKRRGDEVRAQVKMEIESTTEYPTWRRVFALSENLTSEDIDNNPHTSLSQSKIACDEYRRATEALEHIFHKFPGRDSYTHGAGPIDSLANVILHDTRIPYDWDDTWLPKIYVVLQAQNENADAWKDLQFDDGFRELVMKRHREKGWDATQTALVITVQCWIVHARMIEGVGVKRVNYFHSALQTLHWARKELMPHGYSDKCSCCDRVFRPTYLLWVQKSYLDSMMECLECSKAGDKKPQYLEELRSEAENLIFTVDAMPREDDAVMAVTYQDMPRGMAYAALGVYYSEKAYLAEPPVPLPEFDELLKKSIGSYLLAGLCFPVGDEYRARYLNRALEGMIFSETAVSMLMDTLKHLEKAIEEMKPIWGSGATVSGERLRNTIGFLADTRRQFAAGVYKEDTILRFPHPVRDAVPLGRRK
ncbi:hypothetical protein VNI00_007023 [Paramarasmius palmivorus]|uniref:TPR-like protein n=1 Tax=Paramarasmius palmivorus TaxID=297713 RepID=A0AAW0D413_9AGAR